MEKVPDKSNKKEREGKRKWGRKEEQGEEGEGIRGGGGGKAEEEEGRIKGGGGNSFQAPTLRRWIRLWKRF